MTGRDINMNAWEIIGIVLVVLVAMVISGFVAAMYASKRGEYDSSYFWKGFFGLYSGGHGHTMIQRIDREIERKNDDLPIDESKERENEKPKGRANKVWFCTCGQINPNNRIKCQCGVLRDDILSMKEKSKTT